MTPGTWHRVVVQAIWQSTWTEFLKVWLDGMKKVEEFSVITPYTDDEKKHHIQFSTSLYAYSWHDQKKLVGGQGTRQLWIDQVGIGPEFKAANPHQRTMVAEQPEEL